MELHNSLAVKNAFGIALREQRLAKKISQEALAHEAGLDRTYVSTLESGRRNPGLDTMLSLATALNIPLSSFIRRIEEILQFTSKYSVRSGSSHIT